MKLENAKAMVKQLKSEGWKATVYEDYSGRGMYGGFTSAVICESYDEAARVMDELGIKDTCRRDDMGFDYIIY